MIPVLGGQWGCILHYLSNSPSWKTHDHRASHCTTDPSMEILHAYQSFQLINSRFCLHLNPFFLWENHFFAPCQIKRIVSSQKDIIELSIIGFFSLTSTWSLPTFIDSNFAPEKLIWMIYLMYVKYYLTLWCFIEISMDITGLYNPGFINQTSRNYMTNPCLQSITYWGIKLTKSTKS